MLRVSVAVLGLHVLGLTIDGAYAVVASDTVDGMTTWPILTIGANRDTLNAAVDGVTVFGLTIEAA